MLARMTNHTDPTPAGDTLAARIIRRNGADHVDHVGAVILAGIAADVHYHVDRVGAGFDSDTAPAVYREPADALYALADDIGRDVDGDHDYADMLADGEDYEAAWKLSKSCDRRAILADTLKRLDTWRDALAASPARVDDVPPLYRGEDGARKLSDRIGSTLDDVEDLTDYYVATCTEPACIVAYGFDPDGFADPADVLADVFADFVAGYCHALTWANLYHYVSRAPAMTRNPNGSHYCADCRRVVILFDDDVHACAEAVDYESVEAGAYEYGAEDFDPDSLAAVVDDCLGFVVDHFDMLADIAHGYGADPDQMGHDFLLTRSGHGAGYWDRGYGDIGRRLSDGAGIYGDTLGHLTPCDFVDPYGDPVHVVVVD